MAAECAAEGAPEKAPFELPEGLEVPVWREENVDKE
jgi:hypothetical protein